MLALVCKQIENGHIFSIFHVLTTHSESHSCTLQWFIFFRNFQTFQRRKKNTIFNEKREEMPERQQKASWRFLNFSRRAIFPSNHPSCSPLAAKSGGIGWVELKNTMSKNIVIYALKIFIVNCGQLWLHNVCVCFVFRPCDFLPWHSISLSLYPYVCVNVCVYVVV